MNPELQRLLKQLADATETLGTAAWDQAPLVLKDLLTAGTIHSAGTAGCAFVVLVVLVVFAVARMRRFETLREAPGDHEDGLILNGLGAGVSAIGVIVALGIMGDAISTLLVIHFAPRAYLLSMLK